MRTVLFLIALLFIAGCSGGSGGGSQTPSKISQTENESNFQNWVGDKDALVNHQSLEPYVNSEEFRVYINTHPEILFKLADKIYGLTRPIGDKEFSRIFVVVSYDLAPEIAATCKGRSLTNSITRAGDPEKLDQVNKLVDLANKDISESLRQLLVKIEKFEKGTIKKQDLVSWWNRELKKRSFYIGESSIRFDQAFLNQFREYRETTPADVQKRLDQLNIYFIHSLSYVLDSMEKFKTGNPLDGESMSSSISLFLSQTFQSDFYSAIDPRLRYQQARNAATEIRHGLLEEEANLGSEDKCLTQDCLSIISLVREELKACGY